MWFLYVAIAVVIVVLIYNTMTSDSTYLSMIEKEPNLKGSRFFRVLGESFIAINENGYIGIKVSIAEKMVVFHVKDLVELDARKNSKSSVGLLDAFLNLNTAMKINSLSIVFKVDNFNNHLMELKFLDNEESTDSMTFKNALKKMEEVWTLVELVQRKHGANKQISETNK
jgi:hypothetical protein